MFPEGASKQVFRVANRFSLIAAGGELATAFGITSWPPGTANDAAGNCFKAWLADCGGKGSYEEQQAIDQIRQFFQLHGENRFTSWGFTEDELSRTINRAGWRQKTVNGTEFFVFPEIFKTELCRGLDSRLVAKTLISQNLIIPDEKDGKSSASKKPPGVDKTIRLYHFAASILGDLVGEQSC